MSICSKLDKLFYNAYSGLSSPFLEPIINEVGHFVQLPENMRNDPQLARDMRVVMWAGSLYLKNAKQIKNMKKGDQVNIQMADSKYMHNMMEYFQEIDAQQAFVV